MPAQGAEAKPRRGKGAAGAQTAPAPRRRGEPSLPAASTLSPFGLFTSEHRGVLDTLGWARSLIREGEREKKKKFAALLREETKLP